MQEFIEKYSDRIAGVLSGFDRLVLRGSPRVLDISYWDGSRGIRVAEGMQEFLWRSGIPFKHYGDYVSKVSERVKKASIQPYEAARLPVEYVREAGMDKDERARRLAAEHDITSGPVCVLSVLEPCPTFDYVKSKIAVRKRPCHVLYHYSFDERLGWMYARIQTWFPFHIQIGINGREWLARQMTREGIGFHKTGNCFTRVEDFARAQELMNEQLQTDWVELLSGFARRLNPLHEEIFASFPAPNYWTCFQSEWATDIMFKKGADLQQLMPALLTHGTLSFNSTDILRFFGKRVTKAGRIPRNFHGELQSSSKQFEEGKRVKFRMDGNSAKFYSKVIESDAGVLRAAETTINNVEVFKTYRPKEGGPEDELKWRKMRKGIADLHRRAMVSQQTNNRVIAALASVDDSRTLDELADAIQRPVRYKGRQVRALQPLGKDKPLLEAVNTGDFLVHGFRNRDLQALLFDGAPASQQEKRRRSAFVSRQLRMLRAHGLIDKVSRTHRYNVNPSARTTIVAILAASRTTLNQINDLARLRTAA